jgi:hypothetical protein
MLDVSSGSTCEHAMKKGDRAANKRQCRSCFITIAILFLCALPDIALWQRDGLIIRAQAHNAVTPQADESKPRLVCI